MRSLALVLLPCLALAASACAPVRSWERDVLARPEMAFVPDPLEGQRSDHIYYSKEGSLPGGGAGGGGCGCN